jgi:MoaA/NifB/PqqE/SkfB family radical SAM enzyme
LTHDILGTISIDELELSPSSTLLKRLFELKKDVFSDSERIVFTCFSPVDQQTLYFIEWCCYYVDIPFFFVKVNTDQDIVKNFFKDVDPDIYVYTDMLDKNVMLESNTTPLFYNSTLCTHPWTGIHAWPDGKTSVCCEFNGNIGSYNINSDSIEDIFYSSEMDEIRESFRNGITPSACVSCTRKEDQGFQSKRQIALHKHRNMLKHINFETQGNLMFLGGHLGNLCNLKCRICSSFFSSQISAEDVKHGTHIEKADAKVHLQEHVWNRKEFNFWDSIKQKNSLINFEFLGGEPLLQKENLSYLQWLVDTGASKDCMFEITTNGTVVPDVLERYSDKFLNFSITLSIDNIGDRFELERRNANWEDVEKNVAKFCSLPNCSIGINTTVNIQNVYYLPELLEWAKTTQISYHHLNVLNSPEFLSIYSLVPSFKELVIDKLETVDNQDIQRILNIVRNSSISDGKEFREFMQHKDKIRKDNFAASHPEVAECYY